MIALHLWNIETIFLADYREIRADYNWLESDLALFQEFYGNGHSKFQQHVFLHMKNQF